MFVEIKLLWEFHSCNAIFTFKGDWWDHRWGESHSFDNYTGWHNQFERPKHANTGDIWIGNQVPWYKVRFQTKYTQHIF